MIPSTDLEPGTVAASNLGPLGATAAAAATEELRQAHHKRLGGIARPADAGGRPGDMDGLRRLRAERAGR